MAATERGRRTSDELLSLLHVPTEHELLRWAFEAKEPPEQLVSLKEQLKTWPKDFCKANSSLWCIPIEVQELLHQELQSDPPSAPPTRLDTLTLQLYTSMCSQLTPSSLSRLASWYVWLRKPFLQSVLDEPTYKLLVAADRVAKDHPELPLWELRGPIAEYPALLEKIGGKARPRVLFTRLLSEYPR